MVRKPLSSQITSTPMSTYLTGNVRIFAEREQVSGQKAEENLLENY